MKGILITRIKSCYRNLLEARTINMNKIYIEGMRCRLDELILLYHLIEKISFIEACKELEIKYEDVDTTSYD